MTAKKAAKKAPAKKKPAKKKAAKKAAKKPAVPVLPEEALAAPIELQEMLAQEMRGEMRRLATRIVDDIYDMLDEASPQVKIKFLQSAFSRMVGLAFDDDKKDDSMDVLREEFTALMREARDGGSTDEQVPERP